MEKSCGSCRITSRRRRTSGTWNRASAELMARAHLHVVPNRLPGRQEVARVPVRTALMAVLLLIVAAAAAATPDPAAQAEIAHLLSYLETSGCAFYRNGTWHDAKEARAHLEKKRNYLVNRSLIGSTEDFIAKAATASSVSGEKYLVRCTPDQPVPSGAWLRAELQHFRVAGVEQDKTTKP